MEDNAHVQLASVIKGKYSANMMKACTKTIRGLVNHFEVNRPDNYDKRDGDSDESHAGCAGFHEGHPSFWRPSKYLENTQSTRFVCQK